MDFFRDLEVLSFRRLVLKTSGVGTGVPISDLDMGTAKAWSETGGFRPGVGTDSGFIWAETCVWAEAPS